MNNIGPLLLVMFFFFCPLLLKPSQKGVKMLNNHYAKFTNLLLFFMILLQYEHIISGHRFSRFHFEVKFARKRDWLKTRSFIQSLLFNILFCVGALPNLSRLKNQSTSKIARIRIRVCFMSDIEWKQILFPYLWGWYSKPLMLLWTVKGWVIVYQIVVRKTLDKNTFANATEKI